MPAGVSADLDAARSAQRDGFVNRHRARGDRHRPPARSRRRPPTSCRSRTSSTARRRLPRRGPLPRRTRAGAGGAIGSLQTNTTAGSWCAARIGAPIRATLRYPSSNVMRTGRGGSGVRPAAACAPVVERDRIAAFANDPAMRVERRGADVQVLERHRARGQVVGAKAVIPEDGDARQRRARQRPPVLAQRQHALLDGGGEDVLSRHTERGSRVRPRAWCAAAGDARATDSIVSSGWLATSMSAAASRSTSPGGTSLALKPSSSTSATPPTDAAMTGTPAAIASRPAVGPPSRHREGQHSTS